MFAIWAVSGCCPGCCARDKGSKAEPEFNVLISIWGLCWCNFVKRRPFGKENMSFLKEEIFRKAFTLATREPGVGWGGKREAQRVEKFVSLSCEL